MAFPTDPLGTKIDLRIGGVWTDVTSDVYLADTITITRGRRDEGARVDPGKCSLTLKNLDGKYSPRNPSSEHYGLLGRNTPVRVSVHTGDPYLSLDGDPANHASTPDHADLDITGDLDLRAEVNIDWQDIDNNQVIISKWESTGDQRSYLLRVLNNVLTLNWTTDGTDATSFFSALTMPALRGRKAVRVTLDADNGSGVYEVRMYTADTIAGPWTQFGITSVGATVATIYASTAPLKVAGEDPVLGRVPFTGKGYKFEVRSVIDGTIVASPDFTAQTAGATSFTDSAGREWTVQGAAEITNRLTRFVGEISSWPPTWGVTGKMVRVPVEAAGILRRYRQGSKALASTLRRRIPSYSPLAYWPMEEGASATRAYSPIDGVRPMTASNFSWAQADSLPSSNPLPVLASSGSILPQMLGTIPEPSDSITAWSAQWLYRLDNINATLRTFLRILSTGTVAEWLIQANETGSRILGRDSDGATVVSQEIGTGTDLYNQWMRVEFSASQEGSNVDWSISWTDVGGDAGFFTSSFAGTVGRPRGVASPSGGYSSDLDGMAIGHISAWPAASTEAYDNAVDAWAGESALRRMARVSVEEGLPLVVVDGDRSLISEFVGPQHPASLLAVVESAGDVDGGILYEDREELQLVYRDHHTLQNQPVALTLDYTGAGEVAPPLEPVEDDTGVHNDITVTRDGGSSAQVVLEEGPLSVLDPPAGVGRYDQALTLNLFDDDQPVQHASWRVHLGTWDEARVPTVTVKLHKAPHLIAAATTLDVGDRMQITNPPAWLPPGTIDLLAQGYVERIGVRTWDLAVNCSPAGPWNVGVVEDPVYGWVDTDGSELAARVAATATLLPVISTAGPHWITSSSAAAVPEDFPLDIRVGGEVMTVTDIANDDPIADEFDRSEASGWGSADSGQAWTTSGGSAADFSVSSGAGIHSVGTLNVSRFSVAAADAADFDLQVTVSTPVLAAGNSQQAYLIARYLDASNYYGARLDFTAAQAVTLTIIKVVTGAPGAFSTVATGLTHAAGTGFRMRFQGQGSALRAKVWAAGDAEPTAWHTEVADADLTAAGSVGVRTRFLTGNTNPLPVLVSFADFTSPQVMTVTRSVNGVAKGQSPGADVRLAYPAIAAL